MIPGLLY